MPIFMDIHENLGDVTEEDIKNAHLADLAIQDQYGVQFLTFWSSFLSRRCPNEGCCGLRPQTFTRVSPTQYGRGRSTYR